MAGKMTQSIKFLPYKKQDPEFKCQNPHKNASVVASTVILVLGTQKQEDS